MGQELQKKENSLLETLKRTQGDKEVLLKLISEFIKKNSPKMTNN
jgi:hypothetical protein